MHLRRGAKAVPIILQRAHEAQKSPWQIRTLIKGSDCITDPRVMLIACIGIQHLICPSGIFLSIPLAKNISLSPSGKSALPARAIPPRQEGRFAIVTNAGREAVDAAASSRGNGAGRALSVSDQTGAQTSDAVAYGKAVWSWHPLLVSSWRRFFEPNWARSAANPSATVTRRIRRRGEHGISRKAIAQGRPECFR